MQRKLVGSVAETICPNSERPISEWTLGRNIVLPLNYSRIILNSTQLAWLSKLYQNLYSVDEHLFDIPSFCKKYRTILLDGRHLGSYKSRSTSSSCILAIWKSDLFGTPVASGISLPINPLRAARIDHFFLHTVTINGANFEHMLVSLSWFLYHPNFESKGKPVTVWCHDLFELPGVHTIVPVQLIKNRVVSLTCSTYQTIMLDLLFKCNHDM